MNHSLQEQAITRGLRGVTRKDKLPNTYERQYFIRNKNNPKEIKTISRIYNHYSKDFQAQVTQFWVVSEPPEGAVEISQHHAQTLMRMQEQIPFRYGNK